MRPFTIVVASDFDPASGHALDLALHMALRIPASHLDVVHVVGGSADNARLHRLSHLLRIYVDEKLAADSYRGQSVDIHVRRGDTVCELARFASEASADVILVGPRPHRHLRELLQASPAARLQNNVWCPVFVVQPKSERVRPSEPIVEPEVALPPCPRPPISGVHSTRQELPLLGGK